MSSLCDGRRKPAAVARRGAAIEQGPGPRRFAAAHQRYDKGVLDDLALLVDYGDSALNS
jgi:hypothetical protein